VGDIDIAAVDSLKVLDPKRPIREADIKADIGFVSYVPLGDIHVLCESQRHLVELLDRVEVIDPGLL
jgi:hypothetical protein